ncbi:MAG: FAD-dependent oxidoreductase [bacterium]
MKKLKTAAELARFRRSLARGEDPDKKRVRICMTGCRAYGAHEVTAAFDEEIKRKKLAGEVEIRKTGCHGFCARAPVIAIDPGDVFYQYVSPGDVPEIVGKTVLGGKIIERLVYADPETGRKTPRAGDVPFFKNQVRRVLANCGRIDPKSIEQYVARDGYAAIAKALAEQSPEEVIGAVEKSGLRGRGGAGFPTGVKWKFTRQAKGDTRYIVCNADEGDPGAFMDRAILEGDPHAVLEGMLVAAYAIGARHGFIYVRAEYPIAVEHLGIAIAQAEELGLLGENILGAGFDFSVELKQGAGAFVCGEETALLQSIEGSRGMPRPRPPFPAQSGLDRKPTCINNVETFANVRSIILNGAERYAELGTAGSKGTKIFSLAGKVNNTGLVEVPIGVSMRKVIFDVGGGIPKGRKFKAVQMGGPSGGCVPARHLDMAVDYDTLQSIGAIMGSGGMVVMDENTCMVDIARFFVSFTQSESCGKCAPCRIGTKQMLAVLTRITQGQGREGDVEKLARIADTVKKASLCGLGQTCPNPVLSTIRFFRDEYDAHIRDRRCAAGSCEALVISACQHTCPVGIDVPNYIAFIADGRYREAADLIRERNPFPAICGRICHHPCEVKCRRGELDDPLAIRALKRFAADWYFNNVAEPPEPFPVTRTERVAVVGAGPTGLSCAYHLARLGYRVTVFEALPVAGGMLSVAIPEYRLPSAVIQNEINYVAARGVEIRYNTPINANFTADDLLREGCAAVFIGAGTQRSQRIGIPGEIEGLDGLLYGLSFLRDVKTGKKPKVGQRVGVIGGGNTAIDASRTALRLGAKKADVFYRRSREEMPVSDVEYEDALEEGVEFHFLTSPTRVLNERWRVKGLECIKMKLGEPDAGGRRRPVPIPGTEAPVALDTVILAVGQAPDLSFLPADSKLERTRWETLDVDPNTLATNVEGIFAGGDFVTGPTTVIHAIAAGMRGALAIDKFLKRDKSRVEIRDEKKDITHEVKLAGEEETAEEKQRPAAAKIGAAKRISSFAEVETGFTEQQALEEAKRCLRCDLERR